MVCIQLYKQAFSSSVPFVDRNFSEHSSQVSCEISLYGFYRLLRMVFKTANDDSNNKDNNNNNCNCNNNGNIPAKISKEKVLNKPSTQYSGR